ALSAIDWVKGKLRQKPIPDTYIKQLDALYKTVEEGAVEDRLIIAFDENMNVLALAYVAASKDKKTLSLEWFNLYAADYPLDAKTQKTEAGTSGMIRPNQQKITNNVLWAAERCCMAFQIPSIAITAQEANFNGVSTLKKLAQAPFNKDKPELGGGYD